MIKVILTPLIAAIVIGCGDIQTQAQSPEETQFKILAATKGGCELGNACPSYQISADGSYTYTQPGIFGGESKTHSGKFSPDERAKLASLLTLDRLSGLKDSEFTGTCPSYNDGTDYLFEIDLSGQKTNLHSCENDLSKDALATQLIALFSEFSSEAK